MDLIARINELLVQSGWSKYQLAKKANLSQSTISIGAGQVEQRLFGLPSSGS